MATTPTNVEQEGGVSPKIATPKLRGAEAQGPFAGWWSKTLDGSGLWVPVSVGLALP